MYYFLAKAQVILTSADKLLPKKRWAQFMMSALILLGVFTVVGIVFAQGNGQKSIVDDVYHGIMNFVAWGLLQLATLFLKLAVFCLKFVIEMGSYNGYVESHAVDIGWVMVRDLANMFFVVALLVIAFSTILGQENYEWKKMLFKLFLAALAVNFSRTICGLVIDAAQVVMITFINGIAATAGGNLINAFNLTGILSLSGTYTDPAKISNDGNVFMAAVASVIFASLVLAIMVAYLVILLARMIALWVLIVLSPIAFAFTALPQTKDKFQQWWKEFSANVIVGPLLAFFMWLAFAVVGGGAAHNQVSQYSDFKMVGADTQKQSGNIGGLNSPAAGITKAMSWDSMANFFIALGMLYVGAKKAQESGAAGAAAMGKAMDFGKKVAGYATGAALGMWAYNKGKAGLTDAAKDYAKLGARKTGLSSIPIIGADSAGKIKRKAALKRSDEYFANRAKKIEAGSLGVHGLMGPRKNVAARMAVDASVAQQKYDEEKKIRETAAKGDKFESEKKTFEGRMKILLKGEKRENVDPQELHKMRQQAADGLNLYQSQFAAEDAKVSEDTLSEKIKQAKNYESLSSLKAEQKTFKRKADEAIEELIFGKKNKDGSRAGSDISRTSFAELEADPDVDLDTKTDEQIIDLIRERALNNHVNEKMKAKAYDSYGVSDGLQKFQMFSAAESASKVTNKLDNWSEDLAAEVGDVFRMQENKLPKKVLKRQMSKVNDGMEEMKNMDMNQLFDDIEKTRREVAAEMAKDEDKRDGSTLKNGMERIIRGVASAQEQGWGNIVLGELARMDKSYRDVEVNDPENLDKIMMGLISGLSKDKVIDESGGAEKTQELIRASLKEKADGAFLTIKKGLDSAAEQGSGTHYGQMAHGRDKYGRPKIGFRNIMKEGMGSDGAVGTGGKSNGADVRANAMREEFLPNFSLESSKDGRDFVKFKNQKQEDGSFKKVYTGFTSNKAQEEVESISSKKAAYIDKMDASMLNFISGGDYDHSSLDTSSIEGNADNPTFRIESSELKESMRRVKNNFIRNIKTCSTDKGKDEIREAARIYYRRLGVTKINGKNIQQATEDDFANIRIT